MARHHHPIRHPHAPLWPMDIIHDGRHPHLYVDKISLRFGALSLQFLAAPHLSPANERHLHLHQPTIEDMERSGHHLPVRHRHAHHREAEHELRMGPHRADFIGNPAHDSHQDIQGNEIKINNSIFHPAIAPPPKRNGIIAGL